jgi:hypothetical protein
MAHYAKIESDIVTEVIVAEQAHVDTLSGTWVKTSYNSSIRKNYASIGYTYDTVKDAFIAPKPHASWTLNNTTCKWESPVVFPTDEKNYTWDESTTNWTEIE